MPKNKKLCAECKNKINYNQVFCSSDCRAWFNNKNKDIKPVHKNDLTEKMWESSTATITDGWYEWKPNDYCSFPWLDANQFVYVADGMLLVAGTSAEISVKDAKVHGFFMNRIELTGEEL